MAVLGREHPDIRDLDADSLTLPTSLDPLQLFNIPRAPFPSLKTPTHLVVQNRLHHRYPGACIQNMNS